MSRPKLAPIVTKSKTSKSLESRDVLHVRAVDRQEKMFEGWMVEDMLELETAFRFNSEVEGIDKDGVEALIGNYAATMLPGSISVKSDTLAIVAHYKGAVRKLFRHLRQNPVRAATSSVHPVSFDALARHRANLISSEWLLFLKEFSITPRVLPRSEAMLIFHKFANGKAGPGSNRSEFTYGDFLSALRFVSTLPEMLRILATESGGEAIARISASPSNAVGPLLSWQMLCEYMRIKGGMRPDMRWRVFPSKTHFLSMEYSVPSCVEVNKGHARFQSVQAALEILEGIFVGLFDEHLLLPAPARCADKDESSPEVSSQKKLSPVRSTRGSHNRRPNVVKMSKIKRSRAAFGGTISKSILKKQIERNLVTDSSPEKSKMGIRPPRNPLRSLFAKSAKSLTKTCLQKSHIVALEILDSILKNAFETPLIVSKDFYPKVELKSRLKLSEQVARHTKRARENMEQKRRQEEAERRRVERHRRINEQDRMQRKVDAEFQLEAQRAREYEEAGQVAAMEAQKTAEEMTRQYKIREKKKKELEAYKAQKERRAEEAAKAELEAAARHRAELRLRLAAEKVRNAQRFTRSESKKTRIAEARKRAQERIRLRDEIAIRNAQVDREELAAKGADRAKKWMQKLKDRQLAMRKQIELRKEKEKRKKEVSEKELLLLAKVRVQSAHSI